MLFKKNLYEDGYLLKDDEYLFKNYKEVAFISKCNKDGTIPKNFLNWNKNSDIFIHKETYKEGWKFDSFRIGKSQNWVKVIHPEGFILEIYLFREHWKNKLSENKYTFEKIVKGLKLDKGHILGKFKWENNYLILNLQNE